MMFHNYTAINSVILAVHVLILMNYVIFIDAVNISSSSSEKKPMCEGKLFDGSTYKKPCNTTSHLEEGHSAPVTDTEVEDLNHHKVTENPGHKAYQDSSLDKTPPQPLSVIDQVVKPEEKLHNNSRFNISTGGIAAFTCVLIAVVFYVGIMIWKQIVMNGYNNREILLNDEDIGDINDEDMRHFEAACIQIET